MSQQPPNPPSSYYPPPQQGSRNTLIAALSIGGALLVLGIVIAVIIISRRNHATQHTETREQKYAEASKAFSGTPATAADLPGVQKLMDQYAAALRAKDANAVAALFDPRRMIDEIQAQGANNLPTRNKDQFAAGMMRGMANSMINNPALQYKKVEVRQFKPIAGKAEGAAYARGHMNNGAQSKMRMWVCKTGSGGTWRIYDFEDLDGGIRISDFVAGAMASSGNGAPPPWLGQAQNLQRVTQAAFSNDIPGAKSALAAMEGVAFPPQIDALRLMMKGVVSVAEGKHQQGLTLYDQAEAKHQDMPALNYLRSIAYNQSNQPEKAIAAAQKYIDLLGDDAGAYLEIGQAYERLGKKPEALAAYKKGQADSPNDPDIKEAIKNLK